MSEEKRQQIQISQYKILQDDGNEISKIGDVHVTHAINVDPETDIVIYYYPKPKVY